MDNWDILEWSYKPDGLSKGWSHKAGTTIYNRGHLSESTLKTHKVPLYSDNKISFQDTGFYMSKVSF